MRAVNTRQAVIFSAMSRLARTRIMTRGILSWDCVVGASPRLLRATPGVAVARRLIITRRVIRATRSVNPFEKRIEKPFGWAKQIGGLAQTNFKGLIRVRQDFLRAMSVYSLLRMSKLLAGPAGRKDAGRKQAAR